MIASQMCMPRTVPTSVGQGSAGATKARPDQYERKVATVIGVLPLTAPRLYTPRRMQLRGGRSC